MTLSVTVLPPSESFEKRDNFVDLILRQPWIWHALMQRVGQNTGFPPASDFFDLIELVARQSEGCFDRRQ
jgi:hypothetical protein